MAYKSLANKKFLEEWNNIFDDLPNNKLKEIRSLLVKKPLNQQKKLVPMGIYFPV